MEASKQQAKFLRKFIHYGLLIGGMPAKSDKKLFFWYHTFALPCVFFLILGNLITLANISKKFYKLETLIRLIFSIAIIFIYVFYRVYRRQVEDVFSKYDEKSPDYIGDKEMRITAKLFLKSFNQEWPIFVGIMIVCPFIAGIFLKNPKEIDAYEFLYFYSCGSIEELPTIELCLRREKFGYFILNDIMENIFTLYQGYIVNAANLLVTAAIRGIEAELRVYDDRLFELIEEVKILHRCDTKDLSLLTSLVRYQRTIFRHNKTLESVLRMPILIHVVFLYLIILMTTLSLGGQNFKSIYLNTRFFSLAVYVFSVHYTLCKRLFIIGNAHEHFTQTLLEFPWYERSVKFKKHYLMVLKIYQKDYPYTMYDLYEINLEFFAANVKRLYSMANLLLLMYK